MGFLDYIKEDTDINLDDMGINPSNFSKEDIIEIINELDDDEIQDVGDFIMEIIYDEDFDDDDEDEDDEPEEVSEKKYFKMTMGQLKAQKNKNKGAKLKARRAYKKKSKTASFKAKKKKYNKKKKKFAKIGKTAGGQKQTQRKGSKSK